MERMPYQPHQDAGTKIFPGAAVYAEMSPASTTTTDWKASLPVLHGQCVTLRELQLGDAASLLALLTTEEVSRFISPPPTTLDGFEKFIAWTHRQRSAGQYVCFAVVPEGTDIAVGIFQVRALQNGFEIAEWGFAIGSPYWGTGTFVEGAKLTLQFAFDTLGVHRLEARAAVRNGRGNAALLKVGAVPEAVLRQSFYRHGEYLDQTLYAIVEDDWRARQSHQWHRSAIRETVH